MKSQLKALLGLAVAGFAVPLSAEVADVTDSLEYLGNPTLEKWPVAKLANSVLDLQTHGGKVYLGTGDWGSNAGPVPIWAYDPNGGTFTNEFEAGTEAIEVLRVCTDGRLYAPATDPSASGNVGSLFRREPHGGWTVFPDYPASVLPSSSRSGKLTVHVWDVELCGTDLFMCGYGIGRSSDYGVNWTSVDNYYPYSERMSALIRCGNEIFCKGERSVYFSGTSAESGTTECYSLFPSAGRAVMWRWNEKAGVFETFTNTWANIAPGLVHGDTALIYDAGNAVVNVENRFWHPTPFGNRNLYVIGDTLSKRTINGVTTYPAGTRPMMAVSACAADDGNGGRTLKGERISLPSGYWPIDFCVNGDVVYLLAFAYNGDDRNVRHGVWKSTDGVNFSQMLTFDYQQVMMSLEYLDGCFYFGVAHKNAQPGLGTLASGTTENAGRIYRVRFPRATAKAVYDPSTTTLTLCCDATDHSGGGRIVYVLTESEAGWVSTATNHPATHVVISPSMTDFRPTSMKNWFYNFRSLESIEGMGNLHTDDVTDMQGLFAFCRNLESVDVSGFDTAKVTSMSMMFFSSKPSSLELSGFDTSKVVNMSMMFAFSTYESLDLASFNTANSVAPRRSGSSRRPRRSR